ncbi:hypothetical protein POM88_010683 [Heracleum sosnowskyi]|uniref:F-box protein n=1 Tax=Heracleum sosnowskyi TaxID=360622 RepID=A0AAD8IT40_9APIA|nr:hypothetical protein POM88_010683 [Heracleum sosnowskyi]
MNDDKLVPLAFAYDGKLYVLSRTSCSSSGRVFNFEVYSPSDGLWRVLARRPLNQMSLDTYFQSYLILGTKPHEDLFLRPNLAPDKKFFHDVFGAPTKLNTDISAWRTSIFTLDEGARIMGVVCYCSDVLSHGDELSSFATLSIFQVDAESHSSPTIIKDAVHRVYWNPGMFSYARKEDRVEYFRAKLLHNTSLFINTKKEFTYAFTSYGVRGVVLELKAVRAKFGNLADDSNGNRYCLVQSKNKWTSRVKETNSRQQ